MPEQSRLERFRQQLQRINQYGRKIIAELDGNLASAADRDRARRIWNRLKEHINAAEDVKNWDPLQQDQQDADARSWAEEAERRREEAIARRPPPEEIERMKTAEAARREEARRFEREARQVEEPEPEPEEEPEPEPEPEPPPRTSRTLEKRTDTRWKRTPKRPDAA